MTREAKRVKQSSKSSVQPGRGSIVKRCRRGRHRGHSRWQCRGGSSCGSGCRRAYRVYHRGEKRTGTTAATKAGQVSIDRKPQRPALPCAVSASGDNSVSLITLRRSLIYCVIGSTSMAACMPMILISVTSPTRDVAPAQAEREEA
jgi:hypothetical protein